MRDPQGDEALVSSLTKGEPGALERAYVRYRTPLYGFLLRLSRRRDVADDLFQEAWIRLKKHAPRLAPDTRLLPWLLTVAKNLYRSHLRWNVLDMSRFFIQGDEVLTPEDHAAAHEDVARLEAALGSLPAATRELLLLCAMGELTSDEIQAMLKLSAEAYRKRLSRARSELDHAMKKLERPR